MTIASPQTAATFMPHNKDKDTQANNKEDSKGLNFKDLNSHFDNKLDASNMNNMVGKNGEEQLKFAQQLLLKQLQCQTPDNAFDPNQMLETMMGMLNIAQNGELVNMQKQGMELQKALFYTSLSAFRGEVVEHSGNEFDYMDQDQEIVVNLPAKTGAAILNIFDAQKQCIKTVELNTQTGRNSFVWDGKSNNGENAPKGMYTAFVTAKDDQGEAINVNVRLKSHITEIAYDENELAVPLSGRVPIYDIKRRSMINNATQRYQEAAVQATQTVTPPDTTTSA